MHPVFGLEKCEKIFLDAHILNEDNVFINYDVFNRMTEILVCGRDQWLEMLY